MIRYDDGQGYRGDQVRGLSMSANSSSVVFLVWMGRSRLLCGRAMTLEGTMGVRKMVKNKHGNREVGKIRHEKAGM